MGARLRPRARSQAAAHRVRRRLRGNALPLGFVPRAVAKAQRRGEFTTPTSATAAAVYRALASQRRRGVHGDYYEFGIYRGFTFWAAERAARRLGLDMRFFGFDSFEGLPAIGETDEGEFHEGEFACDEATVRTSLSRYGVDWERTFIVSGTFDHVSEVAAPFAAVMRPASVVLVDCDLYVSTVPALAFIEPFLQPGTLVLFDDWDSFDANDDKGERRAFREFLEHSSWYADPVAKPAWHGQTFAIREGP
jgi:O-methyltransferase